MPAKDIYHDNVKQALIRDGWIITHDTLSLRVGKKDIFIDLGAEKFLAAEKQGKKIAVEIKSFVGSSEVEDLRNAVGQYVLSCISHKLERGELRSRGAEEKELVQELSRAPLHPCAPAPLHKF